jgi:hypothetical protein
MITPDAGKSICPVNFSERNLECAAFDSALCEEVNGHVR